MPAMREFFIIEGNKKSLRQQHLFKITTKIQMIIHTARNTAKRLKLNPALLMKTESKEINL